MKRLIPISFLFMLCGILSFADQNPSDVLLQGYGDVANVGVRMQRAKGQFGNQFGLLQDDTLGVIYGYGYNGTAFPSLPDAGIEFNAGENFTSTNNGTYIRFLTTPQGSTALTEAFRISNASVTINENLVLANGSSLISSTQPAGIQMQVNNGAISTIYTSSYSFVGSTMTIQGSGFVGIGNTNPTQSLYITGLPGTSATTEFITSSDTVVKLELQAQTVAGGFALLGTNSNHPLEIAINNSIKANFNTSGGLLLGGSTGAGTFVELDVSTGTFGLPRYTSAQAVLLTPAQVGLCIFNTTLNVPCFSTGTAVNQWARFTAATTGCS